jgi:hypothetical protein
MLEERWRGVNGVSEEEGNTEKSKRGTRNIRKGRKMRKEEQGIRGRDGRQGEEVRGGLVKGEAFRLDEERATTENTESTEKNSETHEKR